MDNDQNIDKPRINRSAIGIKYGIITAFIMIVYFLIIRAFHLIQVVELRFLNYIFVALGMWLAIKEIKRKTHKHLVPYLPGMGTGFRVSTVAAFVFAFFIFLYGTIDKSFVPEIKPSVPYSPILPPSMIAFETFSEIFIVSIVLNLIVMQLFKRNSGKWAKFQQKTTNTQ